MIHCSLTAAAADRPAVVVVGLPQRTLVVRHDIQCGIPIWDSQTVDLADWWLDQSEQVIVLPGWSGAEYSAYPNNAWNFNTNNGNQNNNNKNNDNYALAVSPGE